MKTMLFVDDRTERLMTALKIYADEYEVTLAANVKEALRQMSRNDFALISLDHDLTGCDFEDPDTPTCGMEIVRYLERCGWPRQKPRPEFVIHSSNAFAAHLMSVRLQELGFRAWQVRFDKTREQVMAAIKAGGS